MRKHDIMSLYVCVSKLFKKNSLLERTSPFCLHKSHINTSYFNLCNLNKTILLVCLF